MQAILPASIINDPLKSTIGILAMEGFDVRNPIKVWLDGTNWGDGYILFEQESEG